MVHIARSSELREFTTASFESEMPPNCIKFTSTGCKQLEATLAKSIVFATGCSRGSNCPGAKFNLIPTVEDFCISIPFSTSILIASFMVARLAMRVHVKSGARSVERYSLIRSAA
eukprot:3723782-Pyramimonas_sp.AAC.1